MIEDTEWLPITQIHFHFALRGDICSWNELMGNMPDPEFKSSMWETIESDAGISFRHPKYQCGKCGEPIDPQYDECWNCRVGNNVVGKYVHRVFTVSVYFKREDFTHDFSAHLRSAKNGNRIEEMASVLEWGINNTDLLSDVEGLVPPPAGSNSGDNHMELIGEELSTNTGIPLLDIVYKNEEYPPQKELAEDSRVSNISGKIGCEQDLSEVKIVVIDDIVTTGATMSGTAQALKGRGADIVHGLGIARNVGVKGMSKAGAMRV